MNTPAISLNNKGIQIRNKPLTKWCEIEQKKIISRTFIEKKSIHNLRTEVNYLFFYYKNEKIEIEIDQLEIIESELNYYLKEFRKRSNNLLNT